MPTPLSQLVNDREYMKVAKHMRPTVRSIRRRALVATLHRWHQESGFDKVQGAEIGVKYGSLTHCLCTWCPWIDKMLAIDPFMEYPKDHRDRAQFGYANRDQGSWDYLYKRCKQILSEFTATGRIDIWRTTSVLAASELLRQGKQLHFAYLDARHAYDDVLEDCRAWWPVVMSGGLISGDDYYGQIGADPMNWRRSTTGVSDAVDAFAAEVGCELVGLHRCWFVRKP
jgi:hypothetical protein